MLWADLFTFSTTNTVRGPAVFGSVNSIVIEIAVPVMVRFFGIHTGKKVWDGDLLRAFRNAVAAGGTWN